MKLVEYFDSIVVSGDLKWEKPEPEIFHRVCTNMGVMPFECLIVGDKIETDIKGGFAARLGITGKIFKADYVIINPILS